MEICFLSNYINHHQIPLCSALVRLLGQRGGNFSFIQTQPMEEERVRMGWDGNKTPSFVVRYYEEPGKCRERIDDCDLLIFGGVDEESYIRNRLKAGKPILRYCERMYKTGQWRAISPRGLRKKYLDHTRYRSAPVYVLCAGGYVADDFHLVGAYPDKMFCWGYFPETRHYDVDKLMKQKGYPVKNVSEKNLYLLWSGRMIDWKHPELALKTAEYLKKRGFAFHLDMIGGGAMEEEMKELCRVYGLEDRVSFPGFLPPEEVRACMERADIYLFTSDRREGWGAVANESMNSGCAIVIDHLIGAAPYLIRQGENGLLYRDGDEEMLFQAVEKLAVDRELRVRLGRSAYETITGGWNAENAAAQLLKLADRLLGPEGGKVRADGAVTEPRPGVPADGRGFLPGLPAPVIPERKMFRYLTGG